MSAGGSTVAAMPSLPSPFDDGFGDRPQTLHEMKLAAFEGAVCDKPKWWEKLGDQSIVAKWQHEATQDGAQSLTLEEVDFCLAELRWRAGAWPGPSRPAAVEGVFCADGLLPPARLADLQAAVRRLEVVQEARGLVDWHPGSDGLVRDLVHPSLYCFRRGATPQLADADIEGVEESSEALGLGHLIRNIGGGRVAKADVPRRQRWERTFDSVEGLAWLPSEFIVGINGTVALDSYINNLHPKAHPDLYVAIVSAFQPPIPSGSQARSWRTNET